MSRSIPTFVLMSSRMEGWYQSQVWHGAGAAARAKGVRLVALLGGGFGAPDLSGGPNEIFELARAKDIDGYMILSGGLTNYTGIGPLMELLARMPKRPTVSLERPLPGASSVRPDGGGTDAVAKHLVEVHGLRRMAYIAGPPTNPDAVRRWNDWQTTLARYALSQDPLLVEPGDFMPESGKRAVLRILDRAPRPQAFVCANDAMALGARQALAERGLSIPHDTILTGYDDIEEASTSIPSLTTVRAGTFQMAYRGIELLCEMLDGAPPRDEMIGTRLVPRRSCGCLEGSSTGFAARPPHAAAGIPQPGDLLVELVDGAPAFLRGFGEKLDACQEAELDLWEERIGEAITLHGPGNVPRGLVHAQSLVSQARHALDTRRRQELQHLMRMQLQTIQGLDFDADRGETSNQLLKELAPFRVNRLRVLLFRRDHFASTDTSAFSRPFELAIDAAERTIGPPEPGLLLPSSDEAPGTWAALSLSLGSKHYGVVQVRDWNTNELFLESLRLSITLVLSIFQKSVRESEIRDQLLDLSRRDEMTGLLNRRGLLEQGDLLVRTAERARKSIGIVLCDLDGLKAINDSYGHEDGDRAIVSLARALGESFRQSDAVGRLGGDEFAAVTMVEDGAGLDGPVARLREALERRSQALGRPWSVRTSAGWHIWKPGDGRTLDQALSEADRLLYRDKRARKSSRG